MKNILKKYKIILKNNIKNRKTNIFFKYIFNTSFLFFINHQSKKDKKTIIKRKMLRDTPNSKLETNHLISDTK
jgi:hypothetical protein